MNELQQVTGQQIAGAVGAGVSLGGARVGPTTERVTLEMIEQASSANAQKLAQLLDRLSTIHGGLTGDPAGGAGEDRPVASGALPRLHDIAMVQSGLINGIEATIDSIQASLG